MSESPEVIIVGAGLAGLCCARKLQEQNIPFLLLEKDATVGGRVVTDHVDGFLLDRGFQVLLTAYPEAKAALDYDKLQLKPFYPGALVWRNGRFHKVADFWRKPFDGAMTVFSSVGTVMDKIRLGQMRSRVRNGTVDEIFHKPDSSTIDYLKQHGFSQNIIDSFFRPFFGGVFLDRQLQTSSKMLEFVFRMFSEGDTALPANGMGEITQQLANHLPKNSVRLNCPVTALDNNNTVTLESGEILSAKQVVLALEAPAVSQLIPDFPTPSSRKVCCLYFASSKTAITEPILVLNGENRGMVNNFCVPSLVAPNYAPAGQSLISATVLEEFADLSDVDLETGVRQHMTEWFGDEVKNWRHLRTYRIEHAQPQQLPADLAVPQKQVHYRPGLYVCGDHRDNASINGAMASGRRTAEAILAGMTVST